MASSTGQAEPPDLLSDNVKELIRANYKYLIEELLVEEILDQLYQDGVVEFDDKERVNCELTPQRKARKLLDILFYKSTSANLKFIESLRPLHVYDQVCKTQIGVRKKCFSTMLQENETLMLFLKRCANDLLEVREGARLKISDVTERFQKETQRCGLPHTVTSTDTIEVIKCEFLDAEVEKWQQQPRKRKQNKSRLHIPHNFYKSDGQSQVKGLKWRKVEQPHQTGRSAESKTQNVGAVALQEQCQSVASEGIKQWTTGQVGEWLCQLKIDKDVIKIFDEQKVSGDVLMCITQQELKELCPQIKFGDMKRILHARDDLLKQNVAAESQQQAVELNIVDQNQLETPRPFDQEVSATTVYRRGHYLQTPNKHTGDPLVRIQIFCDSLKDNSGDHIDFQVCMARFAAACLNERSNGTLYFGIEANGLIVGLKGSKIEWQDTLRKSLKRLFYPDQYDMVSRCIRSLRFISVITDKPDDSLFVIEMDVVPRCNLCEEEVFFIKKLKKKASYPQLFRIIDGIVTEVTKPQDVTQVIKNIPKISANRKQSEEERVQKGDKGMRKNPALKLKQLLCRGEDTLDGDIFPVLVMSEMPDSYSADQMKANFQFLKHLPWKAVLDFDDKSHMFSYLEETEELVLKVLKVEDFDESFKTNQKCKDRLQNMIQDLKTSGQDRPWIFANGYQAEELHSFNVTKWKRERSEGFKEAVRYLKHDIPRGRAVIVFLLFSKEYEVMLEAADELATKFANQWFTIAPTDEVASSWQNGLLQKKLIDDQKELTEKSIIGLPWKLVSETICNILGNITDNVCELPTSYQGKIKLRAKQRNAWSDLDILSASECENETAIQDKSALASKAEDQFYRGGEVDWWNFYFQDHVLERNCFADLLETVRKTLEGHEVGDRIECITLYHQPGAGGTTTAKHVLWKLKDKFRCAVVKQISQHTCGQISEFYGYEDPNPKPVLLLFDNCDEERVSALRAELDENSKQETNSSADDSDQAICVFFLCIRKADLVESIGVNFFKLKHELSDKEQLWFQNKYEELRKKYKENPKHLISFNIMKENFNPDFIIKTVRDLLKEVTDLKERKLLKYVSLLNAYNLGFQPLPASAFNAMMEEDQTAMILNPGRWELHLSQSLKVLLYQFNKKKPQAGHYLRIIHSGLSKQILNILVEEDEEVGNESRSQVYVVFAQFTECGIFNMTYKDNSVEQLLKVVRDVVKRRARNMQTGKPETKFAVIIEHIISESKGNIEDAADILKRIYHLSDDVFVGQQLARLYIHATNWEEAKHFAHEITDKKPENSYLWDTYGHIYKEIIKEKYYDSIASGGVMISTDACYVLDQAFRAIEIFQEEQRRSELERTNVANNSGYYQELQTAIILLDCLSVTQDLDSNILHQVLIKKRVIPQNLLAVFGEARISRLLQVESGVQKALARLEDENLQLRDDVADDYQRNGQRISKELLIKYKESLELYYGEVSDDIPSNLTTEEECKYRRRRIFRLGGSTFCSVFELRRKPEGEKKLLAILDMVSRNMDTEYVNTLDQLMWLSVKLTLCCTKPDYRDTITREEMAEMATSLYQQYDKKLGNSLEPYLFAAMFNWPYQQHQSKRQSIPTQEIPDILKNWRSAYYRKYPRQREEARPYRKKETTMFFLGNGEGMAGFAFNDELKSERTKIASKAFWTTQHVEQRLERWKGILINDGSEVTITSYQAGNRQSLTIPTSVPIGNRIMWSKTVYFVIGFTWAGPKAFDIRIEKPTVGTDKMEPQSVTGRRDVNQNVGQPKGKQLYQNSYVVMIRQRTEIMKELRSIKTKLESERRQKHKGELKRKEEELQQKLKKLTDRMKKTYNDLYTNY